MVKELQHAVREAFKMEPDVDALYVVASGDCFVNEQPAKFAAAQLPEGKREVVKVMRDELDTPPMDAKPKAGKDAPQSSEVAPKGTDKTSDNGADDAPPVSPGDGEGAVRSEADLGGGAGGATEGAPTSAAHYDKPAPKTQPKRSAAKKAAKKK